MKRYPQIGAEKKAEIQSRLNTLAKLTTGYFAKQSVREKRALRTELIEKLQTQMNSIQVDTLENPAESERRSNQHKEAMENMLNAVANYIDPKSNSKFNLNLKGGGSVEVGDESFLGKLLSLASPLGVSTSQYTKTTLSAAAPVDLASQPAKSGPTEGDERIYDDIRAGLSVDSQPEAPPLGIQRQHAEDHFLETIGPC